MARAALGRPALAVLSRLFGDRGTGPGAEAKVLAAAQEHYRSGRLAESARLYLEILGRNRQCVEAHSGLGHVQREQGNFDQAIACYREAIALQPDSPSVLVHLGIVLNDLGRPAEAMASFQRALALDPDHPDAHANLGNALQYLGRLEEAVACYRRAVALDPEYVQAHHNLGNALETLDRNDEACECFRKALQLKPDYAEARWALTMSQLPKVYASESEPAACREAFGRELEALDRWFDARRSAEGHRAVGIQQPFLLAYQEESNRELLSRYGNLCTRLMRQWDEVPGGARRVTASGDGRIRVGVVTPYFCKHSVWNAIVRGWFEQLDPRDFAIHAFHLGPYHDEETVYAKSRAAHFEQIGQGLRQWVDSIRAQRIDVLIYPEIGMDPITAKLASLRLAPVQAASWGHPETSGLPTIDYYLSAESLEPPQAAANYSEKLCTLANLGCFYRRLPVTAVPSRLDGLRLEADTALLLCPGTPFKYAPQHDGVLTAIARELGNCRFVFFAHPSRRHLEAKLRNRLEAAFARAGLRCGDFVCFVPWQDSASFYGLMQRADVFLDTIGFSGFNTAMQAVDCGLPMVTREGRFLRGRLASGILRRLELVELVAQSDDEYVAIAVRLARDPAYRGHFREQLRSRSAVLYEDQAPIRALQDFLRNAAAAS